MTTSEVPAVTPRVRLLVGRRADLAETSRRVISYGGIDIGILVFGDDIYAYENRCPHQGGPVCEGMIVGRVVAAIQEDQSVVGEYFSSTEPHLVCPWHGVEYLLETGQSVVNPGARLSRYEVEIDGDDVYVLV